MPAGNAQTLDDSFSQALASGNIAATVSSTANASVTIERERRARFPEFHREYSDPERKWQIEVQRQLLEHVQMPNGWDGYGTAAPSMDTAFFALLILSKIMRSRSPIPQVVPSSVGGVQLEWHEKDIDLELHISAPYRCEMWFQDHRQGGPPNSLELSADFAPLTEPLRLLTSR
jgi:hypothetical protein